MMVTLCGLPSSTQYADVKELIIWKCNVSDYILDSMKVSANGTKSVRVGLVDETEGKRLVKCLDGYHLSGHVLKAFAISKSSKSDTLQQTAYDPLKFFKQRKFLLPNPEEDRRPIEPSKPAQRGNQNSNHANNHHKNQANNQYSNQTNNMYGNQADNNYNNQACNRYRNQVDNICSNQADTIYSNQADIYRGHADNIHNQQAGNHHNNQAENHYSNQSNIQLSNQGRSNQPLLQSAYNSHSRVTSNGHNSSKSVLPGPALPSCRSDQDINRSGLSRPLETVQDRDQAPQGTKKNLSGAGRKRLRRLLAEGKLSYEEAFEACLKPRSASSVERPNVPKPLKNNLKRGRSKQGLLYENQRGECDEESPHKRQRGKFQEDSHRENQGGRCDKESPDNHQRGTALIIEEHHENQRGRCDEESIYRHQRGKFEEDSRHGNQRGRCDEESPYRHERGIFEEGSHPENQRGRCDEVSPYRHERGRFEEGSHPENQRGRCDEESPYRHERGIFEEGSHPENQRGRCDEVSPYRHERGRFEEGSHSENQRGRCDVESPYMHERGRFEEGSHPENQRGRCDVESPYMHERGRFEEGSHPENQRDRCDEESPYMHQRGRFEENSWHENQRGRYDEISPYRHERDRFEKEYHSENQRDRYDEESQYKHQWKRCEEESLYKNQTEATRITPMGYADPLPNTGNAARGYPRVGIRNYEPMTTEQMTLVNAAISSTISQIGRSMGTKGSGPKFHGVQYKAGWLLITCEDRESQEWLMNEVPRCRPWPEARLSVMEERELPSSVPRPWTAAAFIPLTEAGSAEEALDLIRYQNKGLYPEHWKIICENVNKNHTFAIFSLDEHSVETLLHSDCKVYIGMKKILLKLRSKSKVLFKPSNFSAGKESSIQGRSRLEKDLGVPGSSGLGGGPAECSTVNMDHTDPKPGGLGGEISAAAGQTATGEKIKRKRKRASRKEKQAQQQQQQ